VFNILANNTDDHNKNFSFLMDEQGHWRLSPAYDMTYIFNTGGFLPETDHCLMMRGKLSEQSKEDALTLAKENGIRKAEAIIRQVGDAILQFRTFAVKHGVNERWMDAVETTLSAHLKAWDMAIDTQDAIDMEIDGTLYSNVHVERTYKGNFHLYASIDGKERKFVIGKNKKEYALIEHVGVRNLSQEELKNMVMACLHKNKEE
jgi:serine/threonine-protein kinase HipA